MLIHDYLSEKQREAVEHLYGPMMVVAGPGSGKTRVLTERVKYLLAFTKPERICVITFARKAALEMKERFARISDEETARKVCFGTFHSLFYQWLRAWGLIRKDSHVIGEEEMLRWLDQQSITFKTGKSPERDLRALFSCCRDEDAEIKELRRNYEAFKKERHAIDFEDMIAMMDHAIPFYEPSRDYDFFLVDEFQDIDPRQYRILRKMVCREGEESKANLFVVGDEDQSIYAFRGSDPSLFFQLAQDFPGCKRVDLTINYRCDPMIVSLSTHLIKHNQLRFDKEIHAGKTRTRPWEKYSMPVKLHHYFDEQEEARSIACKIRRKQWFSGKSMAVLARTSSEAERIVLCLEEAGAAFSARNEWGEREDKHMVRIRKDLKLLDEFAKNPGDKQLYAELIEKMPSLRYCGHYLRVKEGEDILRTLTKENMNAIEAGEILQMQKVVEKIRRGCSERKKLWLLFMETSYGKEALRRIRARRGGIPDLLFQIKEILYPGKHPVEVITMHGAKGLEFDTVFVVSLCQGKMPRKEAVEEEDPEKQKQYLEEERRLMYVAMTRAKKELHLSYFYGLGTEPSQFVYEALEESV